MCGMAQMCRAAGCLGSRTRTGSLYVHATRNAQCITISPHIPRPFRVMKTARVPVIVGVA